MSALSRAPTKTVREDAPSAALASILENHLSRSRATLPNVAMPREAWDRVIRALRAAEMGART